MTVGGKDNGNGSIKVIDADGNELVSITREGIALKNGSKLLSGEGILTNLQYGKYEWSQVGYSTDYLETSIGEYLLINIPMFIPDNFIIKSAYITLYHSPIYYEVYYDDDNDYLTPNKVKNIWGYSRNLKAYKMANNQNYYEHRVLNSALAPENLLAETEITNAFGTNGFNPSVPSNAKHIIEEKTSIDIKNYLTPGQAETIQIRSGNSIPAMNPDLNYYQTNYLQQTGNVKAIVNIYGYMS